MFFIAMSCAQKNIDKMGDSGAIEELQVTNHFPSILVYVKKSHSSTNENHDPYQTAG